MAAPGPPGSNPSENGSQLSVDLFHVFVIFLYVYDDICFCLSDQCKRSHVTITKIGKHSSILLFALSLLAISAAHLQINVAL